ncbi:MAG: hypothetical protein JWN98_2217 [Abditibacteriota bacterium]|nr:hypothetical protein [Abditibacteriota bacterium]
MKIQGLAASTRNTNQSTLKAMAWLALAPLLPCVTARAQKITLPEGTRLTVETVEQLSSNKSRTGQEVRYRVHEDVLGEDKSVLISRGAEAFGKILTARGAGGLGRKGKLDFSIERVQAADGTIVPLRSTQKVDGKNRYGAVAALALLVSPLGLFMKGKNAVIEPGTAFEAFVDKTAAIDLEIAQQNAALQSTSAAAITSSATAAIGAAIEAEPVVTPPADARAHRVNLKGGHAEDGIITAVSKDKMVLVKEAGTLTIECDKISSIETIEGGQAQPMTLALRSGRSVSATVIGFQDGKWSVQTAEGMANVSHGNLVSMTMNSAIPELK